jgi:phosphonate transport system ATP-binding protein
MTTEKVLETLLDLNREGATLLVNLHDVRIARRFPGGVALHKGRIVFDGPPERLTGEALAAIYAGDPHDATRAGASPELPGRHHEQDLIRIAEGRDGVAAH